MRADGHYFIEPLKSLERKPDQPQPHVLYKAAHIAEEAMPTNHKAREDEGTSYCSNKNTAGWFER